MGARSDPDLAFRLVGEIVDWYHQLHKKTHDSKGSLLSAREQLRLSMEQMRMAVSTSCPKAAPARPATPDVAINDDAHLVVFMLDSDSCCRVRESFVFVLGDCFCFACTGAACALCFPRYLLLVV